MIPIVDLAIKKSANKEGSCKRIAITRRSHDWTIVIEKKHEVIEVKTSITRVDVILDSEYNKYLETRPDSSFNIQITKEDLDNEITIIQEVGFNRTNPD